MIISTDKISICLLISMAVCCMVNGEVLIPSSFMTIDPYAEAQHHHESLSPGYYKPQVLPQVSIDPPLSYNVVPATAYDLLHQFHQQPHRQPHHQDPHHQPHYQEPHYQTLYNIDLKPHYKPHHQELPLTTHDAYENLFLSHNVHKQHFNYNPLKSITKSIKKAQLVHKQVSHDPPLSYNVVPGTHYDFLHQSHQQPHHQPHHQNPHHKPHYQEPHHQPHYQEPHHQTLYNNNLKPHYKPHHQGLPLTPHVAYDKLFQSHNPHTQHFNYKPTKIYKPIKKTPLEFPKKGYVSHKLTPARDDYARSLYFPVSGYNIDDYFYDFPAFGYFNYAPKLHAVDHHRRRRMLNFKDLEELETQHDTHILPNTNGPLKDSSITLQRIARSSTNGISPSQTLKNVEEKPSVITLLHRVPRTSSIFPKAPELPRLLKPRSANDQKNTWLNQ